MFCFLFFLSGGRGGECHSGVGRKAHTRTIRRTSTRTVHTCTYMPTAYMRESMRIYKEKKVHRRPPSYSRGHWRPFSGVSSLAGKRYLFFFYLRMITRVANNAAVTFQGGHLIITIVGGETPSSSDSLKFGKGSAQRRGDAAAATTDWRSSVLHLLHPSAVFLSFSFLFFALLFAQ